MSKPLTLIDIRTCLLPILPNQCNLTDEEFAKLLNRALERIYNRSAQHGNLRELPVTVVNNLVDLNVTEYAHAMAFKIDCKQYRIVPLVEIWKRERSGFNSFVDMGYSDADPNIRQYRVPECLMDEDLSLMEITMLVKKSFNELVNDTDVSNVRNITAIKNAIVAILHEDASDPDTAAKFWAIADREIDNADKTFRGPVVPVISWNEDGLTDANTSPI
ncbi:MAG: hypothetical protein CMB80_24355 [Flammeovirgaceae bacterium]|nr:hypothetical protein [Flammeovirgaceae bacterium]